MKGKGRFWFPFLLALLFLTAAANDAQAEEWPAVEPNRYEKQQTELRTDYIREQSLLNEKKELPKEQLPLTFQRPASSALERTKAQLFLSPERETNTIATKAEKLKLFSSAKEMAASSRLPLDEEEETDSSSLLWLFGVLVFGLITAIFVIIVPRIKQFVR
ncbi:type VII secretion protein EssA [Anoxybacteroides tepidamans]|uniref:type VII secretion protein EssA n=1 Tax=Anoxybacteroides tepidamans TaxID=265948 RepID=UPI000487F651|nr:type VII secretion protein EssA [Anoxybacillus tepidamans]